MTTTNEPLDRLSDVALSAAAKAPMPNWVTPMLATLTHDYFDDKDWIYERKLDGERVIAFIDPDGDVRLMSRNKKRINKSYPEIAAALRERAPRGCVLDGEVVAFGKGHVSDFQLLQPRMQSSSESDVKVFYYVFDCPYIGGRTIEKCPQRERKKVLKAAVDWGGALRYVQHRNEKGIEYHREACRKGWEGIIAKDASAPYVHSRSKSWLKFKCVLEQEFVIGGYTAPQGGRIGFGALLLGIYKDGKLRYAGKVGTGFDDDTLKDLSGRFTGLRRDDPPFAGESPSGSDVTFIDPKLVCEVVFSEWTRSGKLRHPSYKGLRRDKDPKDVQRED